MTYLSTVHFSLSTYMYIFFSYIVQPDYDRQKWCHACYIYQSLLGLSCRCGKTGCHLSLSPSYWWKKNRQMRNTEWHIKTALHFGLLFRSSVLQDLHQHNSGLKTETGIYHGNYGKGVKLWFTLYRRLVLNWLMLIPKDQEGFNLFLPAHTHTHTHTLTVWAL